MAINQNHLFEELNGIKCAIVEKNVAPSRVDFLRGILEHNGYTVVVVASPPPKAAAPPPKPAATAATDPATSAVPPAPAIAAAPSAAAAPHAAAAVPATPAAEPAPATTGPVAPAENPVPPAPPPPPETFTVGVTDVMFNPTNAIFGRLLKTSDGHTVTLAYWQQKDPISYDDTPYFGAV